jgi:hypothetical protein
MYFKPLINTALLTKRNDSVSSIEDDVDEEEYESMELW